MSVTDPDRLVIERLLLLREERLARVAQIERRIEQIVGQPYDFDPPPEDLPSQQKRGRRPSRKSKPSQAGSPKKSATPKLFPVRPLEDGEKCYRLNYRDAEGETHEENHQDSKALAFLLSVPGSEITIESLVILNHSDETTETLYPLSE